MKTTIMLWIIMAVLFALENVFVYQTGKNSVKAQIIRDTDTVEVEAKIPDSTGYKPQFIKIKEKINVDSLFEVAKKYWQDRVKPDTVYPSMLFVAHLDSSYEDDLLKADINLISRIPIDPEAYFKLNFDVKKTTVFVPTYKAYEPDTWGIGAGLVGRFQDSVRVNLFGNISYKIMNYKYFELPITAEIEFGDNLNIVEKTFRIEGRFKF